VPLLVYIRTLTPTVPFWDSAVHRDLHHPGLPAPTRKSVYTMLGRFMSLIRQTVAWR